MNDVLFQRAPNADGVHFYGSGSDISILGLPTFFRYDVGMDIQNGRIDLTPLR